VGLLALVGGAEWQAGAGYDAELLERSGADEVLILPTAAAYENPDRAVATAAKWFSSLGASARGLMVLRHADANEEGNASAVRAAPFIYLSGGSPLHLLSVLKGSLVFDASAGAMVLVDPMVDPRGGAFTVGLGLVEQLAVVPHHDSGASHHFWRTLELAPQGVPIAGIPERTALIRETDGSWRSEGEKPVAVYVDGVEAGLEALPR
jgi:cyanophycinase